MKNYDLIWAREWAGLTQAQAADQMGVHRVTFTNWETGRCPMPERKWKKFLKHVAVNPQDIPKRLKYDAEGFPEGFNYEDYEDNWEAEQAALRKIEGDEYPARDRERERLQLIYKSEIPNDEVVRHMAEYDEEQRRVGAGLPHRSYDKIHPRPWRSEEAILSEHKHMLAWQRDPEGMAERIRESQARLPADCRSDKASLEERIRGYQEQARCWIPGLDLV